MDFFALNVDVPITISVALGDLPLSLMDIDVYGEFLRGFHPGTGEVEDEPRAGLEADVSVVLHPELMTPQNLYVALTRGARHVVVCSPTPILTPVVNG